MIGPRPPRSAGFRAVGAYPLTLGLLATLALGLLLTSWAPGAHAAVGQEASGDAGDDVPQALSVELTDIVPTVLVPEDDLTLTGVMTNGTAHTVERPTLRLRMQRSTPISRSLLERWLDPTSVSATTLLTVEESDEPLPPGASRRFALTVPAEDLPLSTTYVAWGPRGVELTVVDEADAGVLPGSARSFLLWWPDVEVTPTPVAVLAPLVPTAAERLSASEAGVAPADAAADRLNPLLRAVDRPAVDIALDPALLGTAPPLDGSADAPATAGDDEPAGSPPGDPTGDEALTDAPDGGTADGEPTAGSTLGAEATSSPGAELLTAIADLASAEGRAVHALPWADADVAALAHAGRPDLVAVAQEQTRAALAAADLDPGTGLAWPAAGNPDQETVQALVDGGARAVVLPSEAVPVARRLTYTAAGRATLPVDGDELPAVLADERLSAALAGHHREINADDDRATALDPLTARQFVLAETAVITRERPNDARGLLVTLPRAFAGDATELAQRLDALAQAPWVERVGVADLLERDVPELEREALPERAVEPGEIDAADLRTYTRTLEAATALARITPEPEEILRPVRTRLLGALSAAWRAAPAQRSALLAATAQAVAERASAVAARPGSDLLLINNETHIPVNVTNDLGQSVNVQVRLQPRDVRLVAEEAVPLEIPAQQSATAQVPVHAVGSGNVVVDVLLENPAGERIGAATEIQVRVRADWENVGTAVVAGILVVLLVVGLVRTVRRGRRAEASTETPDDAPVPGGGS